MSYGGGPQQQQYGDANDYAQPSGQYGQPQQMWQQPQQQYGQAGAYASQQAQYMQQPSAPPMHMQVRGALTPFVSCPRMKPGVLCSGSCTEMLRHLMSLC